MPSAAALDRYERERAFHDDRFADDGRGRVGKYYAVEAGRARYDALVREAAGTGRVVEYGCGTGSAAFALAAQGADVLGIDLSAVGVATATRTAAEEGSAARFAVMNAERLELPDGSVDAVCGSGILHHLDLEQAMGEVARVLRPGGRAVFLEPLGTNPAINLYRRWTPGLRTPDEHPLTPRDLARLGERFATVRVETYDLLALAAAPLARFALGRRSARALHRADAWLFRRIPALRRLAWVAVLDLRDPR